MWYRRLPQLVLGALYLAVASSLGLSQTGYGNEPLLAEAQKKEFLLHAKIMDSHQLGTGITSPWRLTLSDGTLTHDAAFQSVEIRKSVEKFSSGNAEINFRDSFHFNIAGYELAKLLGLDDMAPVAVQRRWRGDTGALSWWIPWKWMESTRRKEKIQPPDVDAWNKQMYKVRVLDELVYDTDPNLTNVLITEDWKIWRIDFTRAFRIYNELKNPSDLVQCDEQLMAKLRALTYEEVMERTSPHLGKNEVKAVMARRDKIVARFEKLIAEKGKGAVLY